MGKSKHPMEKCDRTVLKRFGSQRTLLDEVTGSSEVSMVLVMLSDIQPKSESRRT